MNLLVDVGNTRLKWALEGGGAWISGRPLALERGWGVLFDTAWGDIDKPEHIMVANVAGPALKDELSLWAAARHWGTPRFLSSEARTLDLVNGYLDPGQLGVDRWAALLGACTLAAPPLGVIDCGTAITIDAVDRGRTFAGGLILPGFALARASLLDRTAEIREQSGESDGLLGRSTAECVASGVHHVITGGIQQVVAAIESALGGGVSWFVTGGDAPRIAEILEQPARHEPDLVLRGLSAVLGESA